MVDGSGGTIGSYRIEEPLGVGGMGRVYRAVHIHIHRTVALKVLHDQHSANTTFQARFLREAQAAAALKHPNVVDVIDFNEHQGVYYLVMEFVPDGSLRSLLKQYTSQGRTLPLDEGLDLIRQAAEGLHYAHGHGMVHRDIKPDNLLLERNPATGRFTLKIADFGLAHLDSSVTLTLEGQTMGTPSYMSPEQCQGVELDSRSDIYSLGIVLYEVVTGAVPFDSRSLSEAVYKHVYVEPQSPLVARPDLSPELAGIILRCLAKNPDDRFATAGELAAALRRLPALSTSAPLAEPVVSPPRGTGQLQVEVDSEHLIVMPGEPTDLTITLGNAGATPLRATVNIEGVPRQWISTPPSDVELAPGARVSGPVRVRVPHEAASKPADYALTVRASAAGNPALQAAARSRLSVQASQTFAVAQPTLAEPPTVVDSQGFPLSQSFGASSMSLAPGVAGARRSAAYDLTLHNTGSVPQMIAPQVQADDPTLQISVHPPVTTVDPGQTTTVKLNIVAPPKWFGKGEAKQFQVGSGGGGVPPINGRFVQQPFFPFWLIPVLVLLLLIPAVVVAANLLDSDDTRGQLPAGDATATQASATPTQLAIAGEATATEGAATAASVDGQPTPTDEPAPEATESTVPADSTATAADEPTATVPVVIVEPTATEATAVPTELIAFSAGRNVTDPQGQLDIYVMAPDGSDQRPLISAPDDDWLPAWSPDGASIVWVSRQHGNHQLYIANADGSDIRRLTFSSGDDLHPSWSSDNRTILFMRVEGNEDLYMIDVIDGTETRLTDHLGYDGYAVWSPAGHQIAWTSNRDGQNEIYVLDVFAEDLQPVRLTNNPAFDYNPVWSPDGDRIAWLSNRSGDFDVYMMFVDGSNPTRWTSTPQDDIQPVWSPDGTAIAYVRVFGTEGHLYVLQGGIERPLATNASPNDPSPRWSPDGTRITYISEDSGNYDIWIVATDGSDPVQLTDDEFNDANVAWYPSGP